MIRYMDICQGERLKMRHQEFTGRNRQGWLKFMKDEVNEIFAPSVHI